MLEFLRASWCLRPARHRDHRVHRRGTAQRPRQPRPGRRHSPV